MLLGDNSTVQPTAASVASPTRHEGVSTPFESVEVDVPDAVDDALSVALLVRVDVAERK